MSPRLHSPLLYNFTGQTRSYDFRSLQPFEPPIEDIQVTMSVIHNAHLCLKGIIKNKCSCIHMIEPRLPRFYSRFVYVLLCYNNYILFLDTYTGGRRGEGYSLRI